MPRAASVAGSARMCAGSDLAAEGQDRRVLEEQEPVADGPVRALGDEALLEGQRLVVVDASEP